MWCKISKSKFKKLNFGSVAFAYVKLLLSLKSKFQCKKNDKKTEKNFITSRDFDQVSTFNTA